MADLLSLNKSYTSSPAPAPAYPDTDGKEMTDGNIPTGDYTQAAWAGWGSSVDISINLGKNYKISYVRFYYDVETGVGIVAPTGLTVYGSKNGTDYTNLQTFPQSGNWLDTEGRRWSNNLMLNTPQSYSYIKMSFASAAFLGELEVYGSIPTFGAFLLNMV